MWGPWTSKTNGDPSMLRLEADPPCGFCMYGEKARGRVELGGGVEGCRRWKKKIRKVEQRRECEVDVVGMEMGE